MSRHTVPQSDNIPNDFPWDDCRRLYSSPDGFAVKFLRGKSDQDYQFLLRAAYADARSIMLEWIRLRGPSSDASLADLQAPQSNSGFLASLETRARTMFGEQFFLLIAVVFLAQCKRFNGEQLLDRFFELHEECTPRKLEAVDMDSPDLSWVDLAELLSDSLKSLSSTIRSKLVEDDQGKNADVRGKGSLASSLPPHSLSSSNMMVGPHFAVPSSMSGVQHAHAGVLYSAPPFDVPRRTSRRFASDEKQLEHSRRLEMYIDEDKDKEAVPNAARQSSNDYNASIRQWSTALITPVQPPLGLQLPQVFGRYGIVGDEGASGDPEQTVVEQPYRELPDDNAQEGRRARSRGRPRYADSDFVTDFKLSSVLMRAPSREHRPNPHRQTVKVPLNIQGASFLPYPGVPLGEGPVGLSAGVNRRQKKNKKFCRLVLNYPRGKSAYILEGGDGAPPADVSSPPISLKGVVALTPNRFRVQLNAFQNLKKKFSRNSTDLIEAVWIYEVTLLISDGPITLPQLLRIGNYYTLSSLPRPPFPFFQNPLEYYQELGRNIWHFWKFKPHLFPGELIGIAMDYFDRLRIGFPAHNLPYTIPGLVLHFTSDNYHGQLSYLSQIAECGPGGVNFGKDQFVALLSDDDLKEFLPRFDTPLPARDASDTSDITVTSNDAAQAVFYQVFSSCSSMFDQHVSCRNIFAHIPALYAGPVERVSMYSCTADGGDIVAAESDSDGEPVVTGKRPRESMDPMEAAGGEPTVGEVVSPVPPLPSNPYAMDVKKRKPRVAKPKPVMPALGAPSFAYAPATASSTSTASASATATATATTPATSVAPAVVAAPVAVAAPVSAPAVAPAAVPAPTSAPAAPTALPMAVSSASSMVPPAFPATPAPAAQTPHPSTAAGMGYSGQVQPFVRHLPIGINREPQKDSSNTGSSVSSTHSHVQNSMAAAYPQMIPMAIACRPPPASNLFLHQAAVGSSISLAAAVSALAAAKKAAAPDMARLNMSLPLPISHNIAEKIAAASSAASSVTSSASAGGSAQRSTLAATSTASIAAAPAATAAPVTAPAATTTSTIAAAPSTASAAPAPAPAPAPVAVSASASQPPASLQPGTAQPQLPAPPRRRGRPPKNPTNPALLAKVSNATPSTLALPAAQTTADSATAANPPPHVAVATGPAS